MKNKSLKIKYKLNYYQNLNETHKLKLDKMDNSYVDFVNLHHLPLF